MASVFARSLVTLRGTSRLLRMTPSGPTGFSVTLTKSQEIVTTSMSKSQIRHRDGSSRSGAAWR